MNAVTPFPRALPPEPFDRAITGVSAWRGRCIQHFAQAEMAITECLVALSAITGRGISLRGLHLVGARLDALAAAIAPDGPFAIEGRDAVKALERVQAHYPWRNFLCHGIADVTLDRQGRWTARFRVACIRSGEIAGDSGYLVEDEAERLCADLASAARSLGDRLRNLMNKVSPAPVPKPARVDALPHADPMAHE